MSKAWENAHQGESNSSGVVCIVDSTEERVSAENSKFERKML